jgi:hypothetical protein
VKHFEALISDRHKALKIKGSGLKTVTIMTKEQPSFADRSITFYTSNVFVDLFMSFGANSECNYEGSVFDLEKHDKKPHMSIHSISEDQIILTQFPKTSDTT